MKQKKQTKKQESGRSMIEMVGVLAVMGLITAGAFVLITSAMSSQKMSRVDDDVSAIVAGTRLLYNTQANFNGLNNEATGLLGFSGSNPYGGNYYLSSADTTTTTETNARFYVYVGGLSKSQCNALKGRSWPGGSKGQTVGTATLSNNVVSWTAATACADGSTNVVRIEYGKVNQYFCG